MAPKTGPGHPWAAFWPLWVPRPIPEPHLVDLFEDFGTLWAPSGSPEQQKEAQRSPNGPLWRTFLTTFRRKSECVESVSISCVFSSISNDLLDGLTHVSLQPAQSKRGFSIWTCAREKSPKSIDFDTISETFFMKILRFGSQVMASWCQQAANCSQQAARLLKLRNGGAQLSQRRPGGPEQGLFAAKAGRQNGCRRLGRGALALGE